MNKIKIKDLPKTEKLDYGIILPIVSHDGCEYHAVTLQNLVRLIAKEVCKDGKAEFRYSGDGFIFVKANDK